MRTVAVVLLVTLCAPVLPAATIQVTATLNAEGAGEAEFIVETSSEDVEKLAAATDAVLKDTFLMRLLLDSDRELASTLSAHGFNVRGIQGAWRDGRRSVTVKASIGNVAPLAIGGGKLALVPAKGEFLSLEGEFGGAMLGRLNQLSLLSDVDIKLTIVFSGTVLEDDPPWRATHSGEAVSWTGSADRLLAQRLPLRVRVRPNIEADTTFWALLILAVVVLVVLGARMILQRGRDAIKTGPAP